jgi:hypothetical protein
LVNVTKSTDGQHDVLVGGGVGCRRCAENAPVIGADVGVSWCEPAAQLSTFRSRRNLYSAGRGAL